MKCDKCNQEIKEEVKEEWEWLWGDEWYKRNPVPRELGRMKKSLSWRGKDYIYFVEETIDGEARWRWRKKR